MDWFILIGIVLLGVLGIGFGWWFAGRG